MSELKPCPFCGESKLLALKDDREQGYKWGAVQCQQCSAIGPEVRTGYDKPEKWLPQAVAEWNTRATPPRAEVDVGRDLAPSAEYLLGYSSAVLRAARDRAEREYRTVIDDCGDMREAWNHAIEAVWPRLRSPKTRDDLDRWTLEAQKEADEWSGLKRPVMSKPLRTLGERLKGEE